MANPQSNLDELMKDPKAAGLLKNKALLQSLMQSPDTQRLMELLDIRNKEEQSIGITDTHIQEIKEYLSALELIVNCPIETADPGARSVEHILFTQPGMRYCQAQALVHSLMKDETFSVSSEFEKTQTAGRILEEVPCLLYTSPSPRD